MDCIYDGRWWIGVVLEKNEEQLDFCSLDISTQVDLPGYFIGLIKKIYAGFQKQRSAQLLHHVQFLVDNTPLAGMKLIKLK